MGRAGLDVVDLLRLAQVVVFLGLGIAATRRYVTNRSVPNGYLAVAFGLLALVVIVNWALQERHGGGAEVLRDLAAVGVVLFPWLLAAFAWSHEGRLPRWLRAAGVLTASLAVWVLVLPPFPQRDDLASRSATQDLFIVVLLTLWTGLTAATVWRLWHAGGGQPMARARTRLLAGGAVTVNVALVLAATVEPVSGDSGVLLTTVLALVAAAFFGMGVSPPVPLRLWWRRRGAHDFQRMQEALIAAVTPRDVAEAVAPTLANLVGSGIVVAGADGTVLGSAGLPADEAQALARLVVTGHPIGSRARAIRIDDSWLIVRASSYTPVFGQDEHELVEGFSLQIQLALERAELFEAHLAARREAERARGELEQTLLGLAHDLRSPTLAITGFAALLDEVDDPAARQDIIGHIRTSAGYLDRLVSDLLELSRIGRAERDAEPVDVAEVAAAVAQRTTAICPEATVVVDGQLPVLWADPVRVEQLLDNLITNAFKHSGRPDPTVTVSSRRLSDAVELAVTDDGRGVPVSERERVFALFQRGSTAGSRGSGLGLGMVRRIAEAYGGTVELADTEVGARFEVRLPSSMVASTFVSSEPA